MVLRYWWLLLVWIPLISAGIVYLRRKQKSKLKETMGVKAAHTGRIHQLPVYQTLAKRYNILVHVLVGILVVALVSSVTLTMRPSQQTLVKPAEKNRDIMLCLDVSSSMYLADVKLIEAFEELSRRFKGQRIGLDVFNQVGSQIFPVTDDYDLIREQLALVKKALLINEKSSSSNYKLSSEDLDSLAILGGVYTKSSEHPSSNAGIGLAGCVQHLGDNPTGRSQSVIFATDNELSGNEKKVVISTTQAAVIAKKKGIRVYALDPGADQKGNSSLGANQGNDYTGEHAALKTAALSTGGSYYLLNSIDVVPDIVHKISAQEVKLFTGDSQYALADTPEVGYVFATILTTLAFFLSWRLKL